MPRHRLTCRPSLPPAFTRKAGVRSRPLPGMHTAMPAALTSRRSGPLRGRPPSAGCLQRQGDERSFSIRIEHAWYGSSTAPSRGDITPTNQAHQDVRDHACRSRCGNQAGAQVGDACLHGKRTWGWLRHLRHCQRVRQDMARHGMAGACSGHAPLQNWPPLSTHLAIRALELRGHALEAHAVHHAHAARSGHDCRRGSARQG